MIIKDKRTDKEIDTGNKIPRLSKLKRRVYAWSNAIEKLKLLTQYDMKMITLTYAPQYDWEKNHIREYMLTLKQLMKYDLLAYAWVAELQKRGAVHYHLYCIIKSGIRIPRPDESGMWPWGMSRIDDGRNEFYISAYTGKKYQKVGEFPKGLRMYAVWILKELLEEEVHWKFRLSVAPLWLEEKILSYGLRFIGQIPYRSWSGWAIKEIYTKFDSDRTVYFQSPYEIVRFTSRTDGLFHHA